MDRADSAAGVRRSRFALGDAEQISAFLRQTCVDNRLRLGPARGRAASFTAMTASVPGLGASQVRSSIDYAASTDPADSHQFFVVLSGTTRLSHRGADTVVGRGGAGLYPAGVPLDFASVDGFGTQIVQIPREVLDELAAEVADVPPGALRFTSLTAATRPLCAYWRSLSALTTGALLADDSPMASALLADQMVRTTGIAALHTFLNTTTDRHHLPGPGAVQPAALRRAVAHIEAHADEPLSVSRIAAAAGTSPRALQQAFRRHLDTTPLSHLRRVRLERAHRELQAADPTRGATVAATAARWGFANPGRFATAHREAFGTPPRRTLHG